MNILFKIAWRNVWRNPRRSWVLISAIALGVFTFLGALGYMGALTGSMINSAIELQGGHLQLASKGYFENPDPYNRMDDMASLESLLNEVPELAYSPTVTFAGMVTSSEQASGVMIHGIDPPSYEAILPLSERMTEGTTLDEEAKGAEILISSTLADQLNVLPGEKIVLMANDVENELAQAAFRVSGLFKTSSGEFDKTNLFISLPQARDMIGYADEEISVMALRLVRNAELDPVQASLSSKINTENVELLSWKERNPFMVMMLDVQDFGIYILIGLLFTAIVFTIINSFLMVIFERIHEFGILMANGTRPFQIRVMLYVEALFIALIGIAVGSIFAFLLLNYWIQNGLDLSAFSDSLSAMGVDTVIYPSLDWGQVRSGFIMIFAMVLLSVLYPAFKASRFEPVDAINYV
ncbi:MAG: ABC transporter permease [Rhodothermaceae bacterium]|nr:ABC transporter permease [Rhodothermaceae bacterium]